jgi:hypothetical protein
VTLEELLKVAQSDPEGGKYRLVLYKQDGMFWTRRGEADVAKAAPSPVVSDESAPQMLTDMLLILADMLARFPGVQIDPRAWDHLLVYAPTAKATGSAA